MSATGIWWCRGSGAVYRPPPGLTPFDLHWLGYHLRLAGMRDDDPPAGSVAAAAVGFEAFGRILRGEVA